MSRLKFFLLTLFVSLFLSSVNGDYYSAISDLERLLDVEAFIVEKFDEYLERAQQEQQEIKKFLDQVEELQKNRGDLEEYFGNPVNAFTTIRRMVHDWKFNVFDPILESTNFETYKKSLSESTDKIKFKGPTEEDLKGATRGLLRLQNIYQLPTAQLADGFLPGEKNPLNATLSASDCLEIGKNLCELKEYTYGSEWLLEARMRLHGEPEDFLSPNVTDFEILEHLSPAFKGMGNLKLAHKLNSEILDKVPSHEEALKNRIFYETQLARERNKKPTKPVIVPQKSEKELKESFQLYKQVCRGDLSPSPRKQRKLRCYLSHQNVSYHRLSPFKIEQLNLDPYVTYIHDVISNSEMEQIMEYGKGRMKRSRVGQSMNATTTEIRTSQNTWLWYEANPWLSKIKQRLEDITGLSTESAEALQLVNYGIGGQYEPHFDFMESTSDWKGNRLLTALFYLNDVPLGGATAFPFLHLAVPPVKGSLLVWYNLHRSLHKDYRTKHAGCPVLQGSKWICNEWFHEGGQEFNRPCGLTSDEGKFKEFEEK
ncbi:prolyl 4-hydroxylase subunit alpha-2-like [Drosophila serrata]|uniref:prolyl 4-hydroxylase subunit alpha-2-like n=1 Tax=Drosophila serrata TaxID=7274 RepID=UPI000A1D17D1|nr:prolyl 4-hydroxylase subunit alpha-2-like [Drosophila serrata]